MKLPLLVVKYNESREGFTLLEILVALVMGSIFITAICALIIDQTKSHEDHQMKVMMQQNGRAALSIITNELMMAGYSPEQRSDDGTGRLATVETAGIDTIKISYDRNGDGTIKRTSGAANSYDEQTIYKFDKVKRQIERNNNNNAFLENVEEFRILYAFDADDLAAGAPKYGVLESDSSDNTYWAYSSQGNVSLDSVFTLNNAGQIGNNVSAQPFSEQPSLDRIRAAKIWLLMRSSKKKNKDFKENRPENIPGIDVDDLDTDNYAYRLYTTTVKLRNMYY